MQNKTTTKSHLSLLFLNIHLVLRRHRTEPKKQGDWHAGVSLRLLFNTNKWRNSNPEAAGHLMAQTERLSAVTAVVTQLAGKG